MNCKAAFLIFEFLIKSIQKNQQYTVQVEPALT